MNDESVQVKDTTAWVIGRICEHVPSAVLTDQFVIPLLNTLVNGLAAEPRVATNVCWVSVCCLVVTSYVMNTLRLSRRWQRQHMTV